MILDIIDHYFYICLMGRLFVLHSSKILSMSYRPSCRPNKREYNWYNFDFE